MTRGIAILFFLFSTSTSAVLAQTEPGSVSTRISEEVSEVKLRKLEEQSLTLFSIDQPQLPFSSVVVRIASGDSFNDAFLIVGEDTFQLREDVHYEGPGRNSVQIIFGELQSTLQLMLPAVHRSCGVFLISAPPLAINRSLRSFSAVQEGCEEPAQVDQNEWRAGLPAPAYNRSFTDTEHLIVHHSATSNSLTDYYNVVRNIYLYHTQVNGWSDIGYNYLIAPDGTIFKGRDPGSGEQDLVLGAHFCGRNSTTMGLCVLGDYRFVEPTEASIDALESLLSWKAFKDELDVLSEKNHPLNASLPVIAGHRQGCATECPGEELFSRLDEIRQAVNTNILMCTDGLVSDVLIIYPNPAFDDVLIEIPDGAELENIQLINLSGQIQRLSYTDEGQNGFKATVAHLKPGVYIAKVKLKSKNPEFRKIILL